MKEYIRELLEKKIRKRQENDGFQTPWKGHPVFKGMHATATCCRKCMEKWYGIDKNKELNYRKMKEFVNLIDLWIRRETELV